MIASGKLSKALSVVRALEADVVPCFEHAARVGVDVAFTPFDEAVLPPMPSRTGTQRDAWVVRCIAALHAHVQRIGALSKDAALAIVRIELSVRGTRSGAA